MDKDLVNHLLQIGPEGAEFVEEFSEGIFLFRKRDDYRGKEVVLLAFLNPSTKKPSPWFRNKEALGNNRWLLTNSCGEHCFYDLDSGKQSPWIRFTTKVDLGDGWWLLARFKGKYCFYDLDSGKQSSWFRNKEALGNNRWLLTNSCGEHCFYDLDSGKQSSWLRFRRYEIDGENIKCFSAFGTFMILNLKNMENSAFQVL